MRRAILRVLILGGTTEAAALARALAGRSDVAPILSLAGRTAAPRRLPVPTRVGGFGGPEGLAAYLEAEAIARVVDATHPFAVRIAANAEAACRATGRRLLALRRPPWARRTDESWHEVASLDEAARAIGAAPRRVLLTIGRQELAAFRAAPQHTYLARTIEPADGVLPGARLITARGPFAEAEEAALLAAERIEVLVTKNAGGAATYAKIAAARRLGVLVVIVRQPERPARERVETVEAALAWLAAHADASAGTLRGV